MSAEQGLTPEAVQFHKTSSSRSPSPSKAKGTSNVARSVNFDTTAQDAPFPTTKSQGNVQVEVALVQDTYHRGDSDAMTYRSFVDPSQPRPAPQLYQPLGQGMHRGQDVDIHSPTFTIQTPRGGEEKESGQKKFGTWDGVFVSCLLNIFGVIMFLRLGWVVGQVGIWQTLLIVAISSVVTVTTASSMSAIATNGTVKAGGAYYLISRAIGPTIGGAIGLLFSLGNMVAVALYIIGFCETLVEQIGFPQNSITGSEVGDVRIYGLLMLGFLFCMVYIGVGWVIKLQLGLMALLSGAILVFFIGSFVTEEPSEGILGYGSGLLQSNGKNTPVEQGGVDYNFFTVFAVFFPAVTGVMAGANISGDLENPSKNIPLGTFSAVGLSSIVYALMAIVLGAVTQRSVGENCEDPESMCAGLLWDPLVAVKIAVLSPLVSAGIYAATFSSALASIVGAPRVLLQLAQDDIIPFLNYFKVTRKSDNLPLRGTVLSCFVGGGCILIGELNAIAPLITMFFMMTYALINWSCFELSISKSPGWRPRFRFYSPQTSVFGAILCCGIMFATNPIYAFVATTIGFILYRYIIATGVTKNWGSASESRRDVAVVQQLMQLRNASTHAKTFRPHFLALTRGTETENGKILLSFLSTLSAGHGSIVVGKVVQKDFEEYMLEFRQQETQQASSPDGTATAPHGLRKGYFQEKKLGIEGFTDTVVTPNFRQGCQSLLLLSGIGHIRPNTLIISFKADWFEGQSNDPEVVLRRRQYVNVIRDAMRLNFGVIIPANMSSLFGDDQSGSILESAPTALSRIGSTMSSMRIGRSMISSQIDAPEKKTMDVWWLTDDGGLAILMAYLLSLHPFWAKRVSSIRVMIVVENENKLNELQVSLVYMLQRFRLTSFDVNLISAGSTKPDPQTTAVFQQLLKKAENTDGSMDSAQQELGMPAGKSRMESTESKSGLSKYRRWLRVRELMIEHSKEDAALVLSIFPVPRSNMEDAYLMAILEILRQDMPPMLFIRGNGENVLTFDLE